MAARPAMIEPSRMGYDEYSAQPIGPARAPSNISVAQAFGAQARSAQMRYQNSKTAEQPVHIFRPQRPQLPLWLRQLVLLQRGSSIAVLMMGGLTLLAYSWSVHSQRAWSQAYSQLDHLRRDEPQLMRTNEVLKEHLAQQAEAETSGLIEPTAANILYLEPEEPRPDRVLPPAVPPTPLEAPLGY